MIAPWPERFKVVRQPNNWTCVAAVGACVVGKTLEEFYAFCGHDGSEILEGSRHPEKRRGFHMGELAAWLAKHGLHFGAYTRGFSRSIADDFSDYGAAVLTVASEKYAGGLHCVLFLGEDQVMDPQHDAFQLMGRYQIKERWPLVLWDTNGVTL